MEIIEKPWGKEEILETNEFYTVKRLTMLKGHRCSLQYHKHKRETIYVIKGILTLRLGEDKNDYVELQQGCFFTIGRNVIHRMVAQNEDVVYLECSTSQLDDVIRIEDDYKRI